jgi:O-antigen/teichoic acid export membrane protein
VSAGRAEKSLETVRSTTDSTSGTTLSPPAPMLPIASGRSHLSSFGQRIRTSLSVLRLRPFDASTEAGRSKERYRRVVMSSVGGGVSKSVRMLNTVAAVPVTIGYLGAERFGLWMSLSSFIALVFGVADLGLGCAIQNVVSNCSGRDDTEGMRRDLSSAFLLLCVVPMAMLAMFFLVYPVTPWNRVFGLRGSLAAREAGPAVAFCVVSYLATIPLGAAARVQVGFQEGFRANIWDAASAGLGVIGTLVAAYFRATLPVLVLASAGAPLVVLAANSIVEFRWRRPWLRPRWRWFEWRRGKALIGSGIQFLLAGAGTLALMGAPVLVIGNRFGVAEAGPYALTYRVLLVPMTLLSLVWAPLWPAYAEAHARNDFYWIRTTMQRTWKLFLFVPAPLVIALGFCTPQIVTAWTGGRLRPSLAEACATAVFTVVTSFLVVCATPLLARGRAKLPAVVLPIMGALAFLPLALPAAKLSVAIVPLWVAACESLGLAAFVIDSLRDARLATAADTHTTKQPVRQRGQRDFN